MTSDAKIGLLLGLVFIFIIAFVVNGLPRLRSEPDSNELTIISAENVVSSETVASGLAARERLVTSYLSAPVEGMPLRVKGGAAAGESSVVSGTSGAGAFICSSDTGSAFRTSSPPKITSSSAPP